MGWYERMTAWADRHQFGVDLWGAVAWAVVAVPLSSDSGTPMTSGPIVMLWSAALIAPLPWRRVRPGWSALAVFVVAFAHVLAGIHLIFPADASVLVALYSVTVYGPRWAHKVAIGASLTGALLVAVLQASYLSGFVGGFDFVSSVVFSTTFMAMTFLAVWAFGLTRRARRETLTALRDRAERLEVESQQQAQLAVAGERARIAREMHDIVAHSLSVIIAQADGGRYAASADPQAAATALTTVAETGRAALADMRRLLGVLRSDDLDDQAARIPQPAGRDIEDLVTEARASGLRISFVRTGTARALPPGAGLTVYRVCQESLTNILKHAGPDPSVTLALHWMPDALSVEVTDDGRGAAAAGTDSAGFGLLGMNERAALFGGTVAAGPRPGGGFQVRFHMPLPRA
jgi:signal transduction histidine kinase